ncbi:MAG: NAD(P)/FAD-dependent oxidoreductase [Actinomycetota bacterium]
MPAHDHDVVVLGSGLAGSILATILAQRGRSVLLLERGHHPRLAIGESLVPTSAMWFAILGHKHGIPELRTLAHLDSISRNVGPSCGVKRGFGYVYHRDGQAHLDPDESSHFIGAKQPIFRESQFYRQDVDHHMVGVAQDYGVTYRDRTAVRAVDIDDDVATLTLDGGDTVTTRFVVDATGRNSVLADTYGLREEPCRLRHSSRTIFNHFRNVRPFEEVAPHAARSHYTAGWSEGTLHHVFDGGWFWVIPFNNYPASRNDLVSVGVTVSTDRHPRDDSIDPGKEFQSFIERFPLVERHLGPAEPTRDFVGTDRIQYSSTTSVGHRFLLLQHAYGFIDPLFSRGIWRSLEAIDVVVDELLPALADDDLGPDRLAAIDVAQAAMLDDNDQMVHNAYRATRHYDTWTAWLRVWFADEFLTTIPVLAATFRYAADGDLSVFERMAGGRRPGTTYSFSDDLQTIIDHADRLLDEVEQGALAPDEARRRIQGRLSAVDYLPHDLIDWSADGEFGIDLTPPRLAKLVWWGRRRAPAGLRGEAFDYRLRDLLRLQVADAVRPSLVRRDHLGNVIPQRPVA